MRGELAVADQALRDGCWEVERLKVCLSVVETALSAADGEVVEAMATDATARAELVGELIFVFITSIVGLLFPWVMNLCVLQRCRSRWLLCRLKR